MEEIRLLGVHTIYRIGDMHVEYKNKYFIISRRFDKGIDLIESERFQQRRTKPEKFDGMLSLLNHMCGTKHKRLEEFDIRDQLGLKVRIA